MKRDELGARDLFDIQRLNGLLGFCDSRRGVAFRVPTRCNSGNTSVVAISRELQLFTPGSVIIHYAPYVGTRRRFKLFRTT